MNQSKHLKQRGITKTSSIKNVSSGLKVETFSPPYVPVAEVKSLLSTGHCAHYKQWSGENNWLVPPYVPVAEVKSLSCIRTLYTTGCDQE